MQLGSKQHESPAARMPSRVAFHLQKPWVLFTRRKCIGAKALGWMKFYPCSRGVRLVFNSKAHFENRQGVFFFFPSFSFFLVCGVLKKMEMSFWEQYLNSQELTEQCWEWIWFQSSLHCHSLHCKDFKLHGATSEMGVVSCDCFADCFGCSCK